MNQHGGINTTLADDLAPILCLEVVRDSIEKNLVILTNNLPREDDPQEIQAEKFSICEKSLDDIKESTKEGIKARKRGSRFSVVFSTWPSIIVMLGQVENKTLNEFSDTKVSITTTDEEGESHTVETTQAGFDKACKAIERDPGLVDRLLDEKDKKKKSGKADKKGPDE